MRICYVLAGDYAWDARAEKMIGSLVAAGHQVFIVCALASEQPFREPRDGVHVCPLPQTQWLPERVKRRLRTPVFFSRPWTNWIETVARHRECAAIIVRDLPLALTGLVVGQRLQKPVVLDLADDYPASLGRSIGNVAPIRIDRVLRNPAVAGIVEDAAIGRAARVIVASEEMRRRVVERGVSAARTVIVRNTPRLQTVPRDSRRARSPSDHSFAMVYAGPVEAWSGVDLVLRAMPDLRRRVPEATLAIVGTGSAIQPLQSIATQLGVRQAVEFIASDSAATASACIAAADLCLLPHYRQAHSESALPGTLFEYMAQGRAVLTSDAAPLQRITEDEGCGASFRSGNPLEFVKSALELCNDEYREQLGEAGRRAVLERYHWERDAAVLTDLFAGLTQSEPANVADKNQQPALSESPVAPQFPPTFEVLDRTVLNAFASDDSETTLDDKYALELHSARREGTLVFRVVLQKRPANDSPQRASAPSRREWFHDSIEEAGRSYAMMATERSAIRIGHRDIRLVPHRSES